MLGPVVVELEAEHGREEARGLDLDRILPAHRGMDRQHGFVQRVGILLRRPGLVGIDERVVVRVLVALADARDPAVESEERGAVADHAPLAESAVVVDLDRGTALPLRRLGGILQTVEVAVLANGGILHERTAEGQRRKVHREGPLGVGRLVGHTERRIEITRREESALAVGYLLLRARDVAVGKLASELEDRTVGPVSCHTERGSRRNEEFVLILEPDAVARRGSVVGRSLDLHAVVAELGLEFGFDGEEVLREGMVQERRGDHRDGVVTARGLDPRVRGQRALQAAAEFEEVALAAYGRTLGAVLRAVEEFRLDRSGSDLVAECHGLLAGIDRIDGDLRRGRPHGGSERRREQVEIFHPVTHNSLSGTKL